MAQGICGSAHWGTPGVQHTWLQHRERGQQAWFAATAVLQQGSIGSAAACWMGLLTLTQLQLFSGNMFDLFVAGRGTCTILHLCSVCHAWRGALLSPVTIHLGSHCLFWCTCGCWFVCCSPLGSAEGWYNGTAAGHASRPVTWQLISAALMACLPSWVLQDCA